MREAKRINWMSRLEVACFAALMGILCSRQPAMAEVQEPTRRQRKTHHRSRERHLTTSSWPVLAAYNHIFQAPLCQVIGSSCNTGEKLIAGVGSYEQNSPNTIDGCSDQSAAVYQQDESLDEILVASKDGGVMTAGTALEIHATVSTATDVSTRTNPGQYQTAHMYYHSESKGDWQHICSRMTPPGVGNVTFSCDFEIPENNYYMNCGYTCGFQIVRVNYGYGEYAMEACTTTGIWVRNHSFCDLHLLSLNPTFIFRTRDFSGCAILGCRRFGVPCGSRFCSPKCDAING